MLMLKEVEMVDAGLRAVYTIRHNNSQFSTILDQDLHLLIDPRTGAVKGHLNVSGLKAPSIDEAREQLAGWCERLAAALREPMKTTAMVPVFEKDWDAINAAEEAAEAQGSASQ